MRSRVKDMQAISYSLRDIVVSTSTDPGLMKHVSVKLPAPVYDSLIMDLHAELPAMIGDLVFELTRHGDHFMFGGVKVERIEGGYYSLRVV